MLLELSQIEKTEEDKRIRKKDVQPFLKIRTLSFSGNQCNVELLNDSENIATVKKLEPNMENGIKFYLITPQSYGIRLPAGKSIKLLGFSLTVANLSPCNFKIIYSDKYDNLYSQDFSKKILENIFKETEPVEYNGEL